MDQVISISKKIDFLIILALALIDTLAFLGHFLGVTDFAEVYNYGAARHILYLSLFLGFFWFLATIMMEKKFNLFRTAYGFCCIYTALLACIVLEFSSLQLGRELGLFLLGYFVLKLIISIIDDGTSIVKSLS
ncbi:hypothetical protein RUW00_22020 [Bacillus sp. IS1]|uniref:hypothetical protein n=1 Tax=Bacillus TaxID=1386 RepID=UPI0028FBA4A2|nr:MULTISPECIES: hypothetical protein [unclassified Bacillus (in: firmicutes)]MDU0078201.1 hypothetical protein [Bacillus sp. IG2]MDU0103910.1 hypothetical protein [Bacillus sp. IS1]